MTKYILFLFSLILFHNSQAQDLSFEHITQNDGLPSPTVTSIVQDCYGFMWFGTRRGLVKYDGYTYTVFDNIPSQTNQNTSNFFFRSLVQANDSTLLLVVNNFGFYKFNLYTQTFSLIVNNTENIDSEKANYVYSIYIDENKTTWLATDAGLYKYNTNKNTFTHFPYTDNTTFSNSNEINYITAITSDKKGNLLLSCANGIVSRFNIQTSTFTFLQFKNHPLLITKPNHGSKLLLDKNQTLWIGTEHEGLYAYNLIKNTTTHYSTNTNQLPSNVINSICEDHSGQIWIGTDGGGLVQFNALTNTFNVYKNNPNENNSLSGNAVYSVYESRDKILWIGTYAAGLNIYKSQKKKIQSITSKGIPGYSLSYKSILCFTETRDGNILIGTDGGGINVFNPKTKKINVLNTSNSDLHNNIINTLFIDKSGFIWVGTYGQGLCRYSYINNQLKRQSEVMLQGIGVWKIIEDLDRNLWIGSLNKLYTIRLNGTGPINPRPILQLNAPFGLINNLFVDSKGNVWMCTSSMGLGKFERGSFDVKHKEKTASPTSLTSNNVTSIFEDSEGTYWIGTEFGGISKLIDFESNIFESYPAYRSYFHSLNSFLEDTDNNLWLATDNGLVLFTNKKTFSVFTFEDGVQNKEFNIGASLLASDSTMYFGGTEGFNYFKPNNIDYNKHIPPVYITDIKLFNKSLIENKPFHDRLYLTKPAYLSHTITLNYSDNILSISFAALDYIASIQNSYRYKLEGFDNTFFTSDASKRQATYTNLPPGEYTFHVQASNNDNYWNEDGAKLHIIILPPWWMTWWFRSIIALLTISALITFYFWRTYSIKKKNEELKLLVARKTSQLKEVNEKLKETNDDLLITNEQLEGQNLEVIRKSEHIMEQQHKIVKQNEELNKLNETKDKFFSIVAHDLRNPVTALHGLSDLLVHKYSNFTELQKQQHIDLILQSSTNLKKLTFELLDWASTQTKHYQMHTSIVNVNRLTADSFNAVTSQAQQKNILLSNQTIVDHAVEGDEKMLSTVLRNLLSNAIKYSPNGRVVTVSSALVHDTICIRVSDQGIGMSQDQVDILFRLDKYESKPGTQNETGIGLGILICKEFVELNNGNIRIESTLGEGTRVDITFPAATSNEQFNKIEVQEKQTLFVPETDLPTQPVASYKGRKILLIDDEAPARAVMRGYLSEHFEIYEAENGAAGIEMAKTLFPEIVICDLNMPVMNGFAFCHQLKNDPATSHIACIILTAQTEFDVEKRAIEAGADEFLTKPYDPYVLIRRIGNQLQFRDLIRKKFSNEIDFSIRETAQNKITQEFLNTCITYIESRISDPELHADDLCKEIGLSKTMLYEKIKNVTGLTVNEFIKIIRLKRSIEYLKEGNKNITEIATDVGFNSLSYFTRSFVKQYGKSPSEFIRKE
ncbi:two-component regulator propeller domain-containing protein [Cytophaga aurantiaca]|uniref:two-component regulator propeller domain-containing protein n=1 Tax=Cytophaga aurantiaca TaxID=29530 RepID=UPI00036E1EB0|nr:two-component regulator propeller domain-containing protein [Cytophaga aurantiaca]